MKYKTNLIYRFVLACSLVYLTYTVWVSFDNEQSLTNFIGECEKDGGKVVFDQDGIHCISPTIVI